MNKKKEEVERMFDSIADRYDFLNHFLSLGIDRRWRKKMVKIVSADQPSTLLDVATGTADMAIALKRSGVRTVVGFDLSERMLKVGREKLDKCGFDVELIQGEAEKLPFADNSFDAVTCAFGVRNFTDTVGGLTQMCRVLRSGCKCYVLEYSNVEKSTIWSSMFNLYFRHVLPVIGGCVSGNRSAYSYLPDSVEQFASGERFCSLMKEAGFVDCQYITMLGGFVTIYIATKR